MPYYSPLRYPGGKRRLSAFVMDLLKTNDLRDIEYVEPYVGGASLALALLFGEHAATIHINDLSRPVYAFWNSVLNDTEALCLKIDKVVVTMEEWRRQRAIYDAREDADLGELGFAAFFLNRTNRSGIIGGGVIGGKGQTGKWRLDARFTKAELIWRIQRIGRYRNRIRLYQQDALDFTNDVVSSLHGNVFAFYDPPYIDRGKALYLNAYTIEDHRRLAARVERLEQPLVVTYDYDAAMRHDLYPDHSRLAFELSYSAQDRHKGKEVMFLSRRLSLPPLEPGNPSLLISPRGRDYPVYATVERMEKPPAEAAMPEAETKNPRYRGARPEDVARALLRVPRPRRKAVGRDEITVEQPTPDETGGDSRHLR